MREHGKTSSPRGEIPLAAADLGCHREKAHSNSIEGQSNEKKRSTHPPPARCAWPFDPGDLHANHKRPGSRSSAGVAKRHFCFLRRNEKRRCCISLWPAPSRHRRVAVGRLPECPEQDPLPYKQLARQCSERSEGSPEGLHGCGHSGHPDAEGLVQARLAAGSGMTKRLSSMPAMKPWRRPSTWDGGCGRNGVATIGVAWPRRACALQVIGERLAAEAHVRCAILNTFNRLGMPVTVAHA